MRQSRESGSAPKRGRVRATTATALGVLAFAGMPALAGGLLTYEVGTADVGLASAGSSARAQDAATVFTNPAGMTRLAGNQLLLAGQIDYANIGFSLDGDTAPGLGTDDGGRAFGSNGWFLGGGSFYSHSLSPDLKLGLAVTGNFGAPLDYGDDWAGRYYVQEATLLGLSILPAIAYRVNDRLSVGASLNAMYGIYDNKVAINNVAPGLGDGRLELDDRTWGWGVNLGLLYEIDPATRVGLTWRSAVDLDFDSAADFSNLAPGIRAVFDRRGLLDADIEIGIQVPQQVMFSLFRQVNERWAVLGSVGWQQWSEFGQVQLGVDNARDPDSVTTELDFDDTWHVALGAQYRVSDPWLLNVGVAYDSGFQSGDVSPLLPVNSTWRFGIGGQRRLSDSSHWGIAAEYMYGGTLDTDLTSELPVALGGRGDLVGSYDNTGTLFLAVYYSSTF